MSSYMNQFLFGYYPYLALTVFFLGSLIRFDREQYTWKSDSSQLLRRSQLRWGSNLFHIGILGIFFGHFVGLLTPLWVWHALSVTAPAKQMLAIVAGGIAGVMCFVGLVMLLHRRLVDLRIRVTSKPMDILVLVLLLAQLSLGLLSITVSWAHLDGGEMLRFMEWAQRIVTFRAGAAELIAVASPVFKIHIVLGLTIFLIFPFTRLVHIWSGFAAVYYVFRPYQVVRQR
ncbi:MAG TPA: respiratory nitrate reductase subunit gamma [Burkholderiales bacterium]|nr:respiratory nitrate reductase subunit gamma [Burkholderiales bacterium]